MGSKPRAYLGRFIDRGGWRSLTNDLCPVDESERQWRHEIKDPLGELGNASSNWDAMLPH